MSEKENIDQIIQRFFSIFNNTNGQKPNWQLIHNICLKETIIVKKSKLSSEIYSLESFIEPRKKILSDGTLTEFEEHEISEETKISGSIAQRSSVFQKSGYLNGESFTGSGTKFFQLILTEDGWKINAVIWEDH